MDQKKNALLSGLYSELVNAEPKTADEYIDITGRAIGSIADEFGIAKVICIVVPPEDDLLEFNFPKRLPLFGDKAENRGSPVIFSRSFAETGKVSFEVYPEEDSNTAAECRQELNGVFRLFHHILNALLFDSLYSRLTTHDLITGIPNLSYFMQFCEKHKEQGTIGGYTALNFNIRNFKSIYNSLTYLEGNNVIREYCRIVSKAVTKKELVAHIGGDNFAAVILNENMDYFLDLIGNMVVRYRKGERTFMFTFGATVGAFELENTGDDPGEIIMHIGAAYQEAREKRTLLCYYDKKAELDLLRQKIILSAFSHAMLAGEFKVVYQPKVSIKDKTLCGAEALVRWFRSDGSMVMPGDFIPVLEKDGCICALDFYVLEEVCKFQRKMIKSGIEPVKISVNFSKRHLSDNKLVEEIAGMADMYEIPHEYVEVELTEGEDFRNNSIMKDVVDDLGMQGIKTSIDDFGTGYSSLGMLCDLSLDTLKIDRSFIPGSSDKDNEKRMLMLKSVVGLAKDLSLTTVAEGVETPEQIGILENMGCDMIQGYIFDKPLSEEEFIKRLKRRVYTVNSDE